MKGLALLLSPKAGKGAGDDEPAGNDDGDGTESGSVDERCDLLADVLGVPKDDREDFCQAFTSAVKAIVRSADDDDEETEEEPG